MLLVALVVFRREGEVLGSWGGKSVVLALLAVVAGNSLLGYRSCLGGGCCFGGASWGVVVVGVVGGWRKWQVQLVELEGACSEVGGGLALWGWPWRWPWLWPWLGLP